MEKDLTERYSQEDVYLTSTREKGLADDSVGGHVYVIEKAKPPTEFDEPYHKLPSTVDFERIVSNVKNSLGSLQRKVENSRSKENENINEKFKRYLLMEESKAIVSDAFWLAICVLFKAGRYPKSESELLKRIARNYMGFMLDINPELDSSKSRQNDLFFEHYYDILSQAVFYCFFYAFPKSRALFDVALKRRLLLLFSQLFTGIEMPESKLEWNIDLGQGNILKRRHAETDSRPERLPSLTRLTQERKKKKAIRYSPIMQIYLNSYNYRTRNYVREYRMKLTQPDPDSERIERLFRQNAQEERAIMQRVSEARRAADKSKVDLENYIKQLKKETINHHRRLEKRKAEQLERGAHEYANYLVSMMNAGVTMTNLGAVQQS